MKRIARAALVSSLIAIFALAIACGGEVDGGDDFRRSTTTTSSSDTCDPGEAPCNPFADSGSGSGTGSGSAHSCPADLPDILTLASDLTLSTAEAPTCGTCPDCDAGSASGSGTGSSSSSLIGSASYGITSLQACLKNPAMFKLCIECGIICVGKKYAGKKGAKALIKLLTKWGGTARCGKGSHTVVTFIKNGRKMSVTVPCSPATGTANSIVKQVLDFLI